LVLNGDGMDEKIVHEILQDLFSSLEALETQSRATSQFLKDKGIVNEEELAPYLEQAGTRAASDGWPRGEDRLSAFGTMKAAERKRRKNRRRLRRPAENEWSHKQF